MSPARAHQARVLAALSAAGGAVGIAGPVPSTGPAATAYEQQLLQLAEDKRQLKAIQSVEKKIELKRELIVGYVPWIDGVLAGAAEHGRASQDEIVTTIMVWRIDAGDYFGALAIAAHVLRYRLVMPERYKRQPATLIVEEIAEAALRALAAAGSFPVQVLLDCEDVVDGHDMPDEVRAKLNKAIGLELVRAADADEPDSAARVAGFAATCRGEALTRFRRAFELNSAIGVKKNIEKLEAALRKETVVVPILPPATDTTNTNAGEPSG